MLSRNIGVTITDQPIDWDVFVAAAAEAAGVPAQYMAEYYSTYECHIAGTPEQIAQGVFDHVIKLGIHQPIIQFGRTLGAAAAMPLDRAMDVFMNQIAPRVVDLARIRA